MHEVVLSFGEQDRTVPLVQLSVEEKLVDSIPTVSGEDMLVKGFGLRLDANHILGGVADGDS